MIAIDDFIYESEVSVNDLCDFIVGRYPSFKFKKCRCEYCEKILYTAMFSNAYFQIDIHCFDHKAPKYKFDFFAKINNEFVKGCNERTNTIIGIDKVIDKFLEELKKVI